MIGICCDCACAETVVSALAIAASEVDMETKFRNDVINEVKGCSMPKLLFSTRKGEMVVLRREGKSGGSCRFLSIAFANGGQDLDWRPQFVTCAALNESHSTLR